MIYIFRCDSCGEVEELQIPLTYFEESRKKAWCADCKERAKLVITGGKSVFARSPFPKGWNEHIAPDPVYIRDRKHAMDVAAESGLTSVYCENKV